MRSRLVNLLFVAAGVLLVASVVLAPSPSLGLADIGALGAGLGNVLFGLFREFSPGENREVPEPVGYLLLALVVAYALWFLVEVL
jgi:hypothetical protein